MAEHLYQFGFSEDSIRETNHYMLFLLLPVLIICVVGSGLFITGFKIKEALICSFIAILITIVIWAIEIPLITRSNRKIKAFIDTDKIIKQCGKHEECIPWDNIARIKINRNSKGKISNIWIIEKNKRSLRLFGFNEMEKLAGLIKDRIPSDIPLSTKKDRFNQQLLGIISAVITMAVMTIITSFGPKAIDIFAILFAFAVCVFLFLCRPLTKSDIRLKWTEIVCALLLLFFGLCGLIGFLYTGRLP